MRERVHLVPRDLLGEEPVEAGPTDEARQGRRVAEAVRQPHAVTPDTELLLEEPLPVEELPHHRLARRHDRVALDPHAAERDEPPGRHCLLHPLEHLGPVVLDPLVLLGARHAVEEVVGLVDELGHGRAGASHLADGLAHRPQPRGVDVRVADGGDLVRALAGASAQGGGQRLAGIGRSFRDPLQLKEIQGVVQCLEDLHPPRPVRQLGLELEQDLDVQGKLLHLLLEHRELDPARGVQRCGRGRLDVALLRGQERVVFEQDRVRRRLEKELDDILPCCGIGYEHPLVARVDGLHRRPVRPVDQALALEARHVRVEPEVDQQLHAPPGPLGGNPTREPEPGRPPGGAPRHPDLVRRVGQPQPLRRWHRLARELVPLDRDGSGHSVHCWLDPLLQHTLRPADGQDDVIVHGCLSSGCRGRCPVCRCVARAAGARGPFRERTPPPEATAGLASQGRSTGSRTRAIRAQRRWHVGTLSTAGA